MKKFFALLLGASLFGTVSAADSVPAVKLDSTVRDLTDKPQVVTVKFPAVSVPEGQVALLSGRIFYKSGSPSGWSNGLRMKLNGSEIERYNEDGEERLLRRGTAMECKFSSGKTSKRAWYDPSQGWLTLYGPGTDKMDSRITSPREEQYKFLFDVTDLLNADGENVLEITVIRTLAEMSDAQKPFHFEDAQITFLPAAEADQVRPAKQ